MGWSDRSCGGEHAPEHPERVHPLIVTHDRHLATVALRQARRFAPRSSAPTVSIPRGSGDGTVSIVVCTTTRALSSEQTPHRTHAKLKAPRRRLVCSSAELYRRATGPIGTGCQDFGSHFGFRPMSPRTRSWSGASSGTGMAGA